MPAQIARVRLLKGLTGDERLRLVRAVPAAPVRPHGLHYVRESGGVEVAAVSQGARAVIIRQLHRLDLDRLGARIPVYIGYPEDLLVYLLSRYIAVDGALPFGSQIFEIAKLPVPAVAVRVNALQPYAAYELGLIYERSRRRRAGNGGRCGGVIRYRRPDCRLLGEAVAAHVAAGRLIILAAVRHFIPGAVIVLRLPRGVSDAL